MHDGVGAVCEAEAERCRGEGGVGWVELLFITVTNICRNGSPIRQLIDYPSPPSPPTSQESEKNQFLRREFIIHDTEMWGLSVWIGYLLINADTD